METVLIRKGLAEIENKIDGTAFHKELRAAAPVYFDEDYQAYVVSRYDDVAFVLREPVLFSSAKVMFHSYRFEEIVNGILKSKASGPFKDVLLMVDPPNHARVRTLASLGFSQRRIASLQGDVERVTNALIDRFIDDGSFEVYDQLGQPLAVTILGKVLGVPEDHWRDVLRWTAAYTITACNRIVSEDHATEIGNGLADLQNFIVRQLDARRKSPQDDVLTDLINARAEGYEPLDDEEIVAMGAIFIGAGHETTTSAIIAMIKLFAEQPEQLEALRTAPNQDAAIKSFCEELLRTAPPLNAQIRFVTAATEIAGVKIPENSLVIIVNASANRDEKIFGSDADEFRPGRANASRHMTFGGGIHMCLGNMLARMELQCVARAMANRFKRFRLISPEIPLADYSASMMDWNYSLMRLEVEFEKR